MRLFFRAQMADYGAAACVDRRCAAWGHVQCGRFGRPRNDLERDDLHHPAAPAGRLSRLYRRAQRAI